MSNATTEKRLYAVKVGDPDWAEVIITTHEERIEDARKWAEANGYDRFRVASFTWGEPVSFLTNSRYT